ncbi:HlyD family secretion protein [Alicyclobacillus tolerans]|uniref:Multidrug resistance efflux pump n=2 Tax=Alicyclobacillus tolerans TaxID=90970 RepID=A0ABT9LV74_9BACL|nr:MULTISPECIES: HlyD family efflux transporter periplasmic adaptor subunit [Alicyclobacillus]MDP9728174.1 multidrug resistance efflux pump [Alicyclobacillus tengchongensis]QRF23398.1 HlyD family secretion protein [Alicyclobacillus sp. TC]SHJ84434.1 HlyD family secretion protein [Alicyclobacillus montanus]
MNARRLLIINVIILLVIVIAGFVGYYFYNQSTLYLTTDDASVTGKQIVIAAPASGKVVDWNGTFGRTFTSGDTVGDVQMQQGTKTVDVAIPMPQDGTVVQNEAVDNEFVAAGTPLAYAYNMQQLYVTANIKETQISQIKIGQNVNVYVDAFPGITIKGTVEDIGMATASTFSLLPTQSTTADFTKVTQVIPVRIALQGYQGIGLVPGMSATVKIHK